MLEASYYIIKRVLCAQCCVLYLNYMYKGICDVQSPMRSLLISWPFS
jgi:hypothetical protein